MECSYNKWLVRLGCLFFIGRYPALSFVSGHRFCRPPSFCIYLMFGSFSMSSVACSSCDLFVQSTILFQLQIMDVCCILLGRRPTTLQDRTRDSDDDDYQDRDYDVAALANNLSQAFKYGIYSNDASDEVCFVSFCSLLGPSPCLSLHMAPKIFGDDSFRLLLCRDIPHSNGMMRYVHEKLICYINRLLLALLEFVIFVY